MKPFIYQSITNGSVRYSFLRKMGLIVYLAALKKGAIRVAHPYYVIYRELPPPPERLIELSIHGKLYFVLVIFDGINLSIAALTSDLKLTNVSLTDE